MAKTQAVMATKCEANSSSQVGAFLSARSTGISATVIGIKRTDASATAMAAGMKPTPEAIAPVNTTMLGSAQTRPAISSVCGSVSPLSRARPA